MFIQLGLQDPNSGHITLYVCLDGSLGFVNQTESSTNVKQVKKFI